MLSNGTRVIKELTKVEAALTPGSLGGVYDLRVAII